MINFQEILIQTLSNTYESIFPLLLLLLCVFIVLYYFRHDITSSYKQIRKLENSMVQFIAIFTIATILYLVINQYYFLLFLMVLLFIMYLIYKIGLFDKYILDD